MGLYGPLKNKPVLFLAFGLVRQLLVEKFRDRVVAAREKRALVVGNPRTPFADLPGAEKEAQAVVKAMRDEQVCAYAAHWFRQEEAPSVAV